MCHLFCTHDLVYTAEIQSRSLVIRLTPRIYGYLFTLQKQLKCRLLGPYIVNWEEALGYSPVAKTSFSHILTAYKIVRHFFGQSYLNISWNNRVGNTFFRISIISVPCSHAQLRGRTVIKSYGHFSDLGVETALSYRYVEFLG